MAYEDTQDLFLNNDDNDDDDNSSKKELLAKLDIVVIFATVWNMYLLESLISTILLVQELNIFSV